MRSSEPSGVETAFGVVLLLSVASVLVSVAAGDRVVPAIAAGVMQGVALVAALLTSKARRPLVVGSIALAMLATGIAAVLAATPTVAHHPAVPSIWSLIILATIGAVGGRVTRFERVNMQTVLALLTVYVLIGLLFAYVFALVQSLTGRFFTGGANDTASFVYFSYIAVATVGFGDLVPMPGLPRALTVLEAIVGQLYLVSVVALAVGRFGSRRAALDDRQADSD